jgi:hypothetical protein
MGKWSELGQGIEIRLVRDQPRTAGLSFGAHDSVVPADPCDSPRKVPGYEAALIGGRPNRSMNVSYLFPHLL